jgi:hypothetical protein
MSHRFSPHLAIVGRDDQIETLAGAFAPRSRCDLVGQALNVFVHQCVDFTIRFEGLDRLVQELDERLVALLDGNGKRLRRESGLQYQ